ncbi:unnamed protein product [Leptidea sinapis]|uniref:Ig-like domain-containing protein n=1 Tax=Leptidea sinapis TaxID=189913 RepID=A0A5E4QZG2_9NEOP|nr:unnamed protein product [Leptidea sinapis]
MKKRIPPNKIAISGVGEHVTQGTILTLMCVVSGARPAATIEWYNGTHLLSTDSHNIQKDGRTGIHAVGLC